jgi:hypothetical protein
MSDDEHGSGGESTFTVVLAFFANAGIALAKTVVALITGSASMLAESAHSWADTGNEVAAARWPTSARDARPTSPGRSGTAGRHTCGRCSRPWGSSSPVPWSRSGTA